MIPFSREKVLKQERKQTFIRKITFVGYAE
jgi:hypothetical protein